MRQLFLGFALLAVCAPCLNAQEHPAPASNPDWRYTLTIHEIARADDDERLTQLLNDNPDRTRARTADGRTPVHAAAEAGALKALKVLAKHGADLNVVDNGGRTPLSIAASLDYMTTVKTLAELGADVNKPALVEGGGTQPLPPVIIAARRGYTELLKVLLDAKADLNRKGSDGSYALTAAAESGRWETVKVLVDRGADVNVADAQGMTILMFATHEGDEGLVRTLLEKGADPRAQDTKGRAPLSFTESPALWKMLVDKGADVNVVVGGLTPLQYFIARGNVELIRTWLTYHPDPLTPDRKGKTAKELAQMALAGDQQNLARREIVRLVDDYQNKYYAEQHAAAPN
jgi:ankyrin repeat protein